MERATKEARGRVVLATVKGDVHDIGKNLVDIILTNNGYEVINLGIKVGVKEMLSAVRGAPGGRPRHERPAGQVDVVMRENLEIMNERAMSRVPVLLGGAALTRTYVERDLREVYDGRLFYGKDAFEGLRVLDQLGETASQRARRSHLRSRGVHEARCSAVSESWHPPSTPPSLDEAPRLNSTIVSSFHRSSAAEWRRASLSTTSASS